jgi:beta-barrel assembly-enhancing protease
VSDEESMNRVPAVFSIQILLLTFAFGATVPNCGEGLGGFLISSEQEVEMGDGVDKELEKEFVIVDAADPVAQWAVQLVAPLEAASKPFRDPALIGGYKVEVIADKNLINAFAAPGGYVYITTALIEASSSCGELAGVLGHELAHVTERHSVKQIEGSFAVEQILAFFVEDSEQLLADAAKTIWAFLSSTKFSRDHEAEADEVGMQIAYDAGYNPYGLVDFFRKILALEQQAKEQTGLSTPEFLSSHPATQSRIDDVSKMINDRYGEKVVEGKSQSYECIGTTMSFTDVQKLISEDKLTLRTGTGPPPANL